MIARTLIAGAFCLFGLNAAHARCAGDDLATDIRAGNEAAYAEAERTAERTLNGEGVLWKVEAPDVPPSYLFGTFHALPVERAKRGAEALAIARASRVVLVELTADELAEMQTTLPTATSLFLNEAPAPLEEWLAPDMVEKAADVLAPYGMTPAMAAMIQPWFLQVIIATPPCLALAMQEGLTPMDSTLEAASGGEARGLEKWREQIEAFRQGTLEEQRHALRLAFATPYSSENMLATQRILYDREQVAMIWELSLLLARQELPASLVDSLAADAWRFLIANRNARMAEAAIPEMREGGALLAVGALHLVGRDGLVNLLREAGFTVERALPQ